MKIHHGLIPLLTMLAVATGFAQQSRRPPQPAPTASPPEVAEQKSELTKFDLDFPGGTPNQLVAAIQKAMGRPLNAIVLVEFADVQLPPLKMNGVNVAQLFEALTLASPSRQITGVGRFLRAYDVQFGFLTKGPPSDASVWYFYRRGEVPILKESRFFLLTPYLDKGLSVDDITTAIQTGWKMSGVSAPPTMSFHPETKLLIAVGDPGQLATIDAVLEALKGPTAAPPAAVHPPSNKPTEAQKKER